MSQYDDQAREFLQKTGATIEIKYSRTGKHFEDDEDERDIYDVTIKRGDRRSYSFKFGNSINNSFKWIKVRNAYQGWIDSSNTFFFGARKNPNYRPPSEYDVLICLTKSDPGLFGDFCSEYGYDTDSCKAKRIYESVREEFLNVKKLFSYEELEQMQEIQ